MCHGYLSQLQGPQSNCLDGLPDQLMKINHRELFLPNVKHFNKNPEGSFRTVFVMNELHLKETKVSSKKMKVNLEKHSNV